MADETRTDFVVVGSGIAGLRAAIELVSKGEVWILTKARPAESNTEYAQGGIAAALSDEDEISLHYEDTLRAGDGLCNQEAVRVLVEEGPGRIQELIDWGVAFDRQGNRLAFAREGAHSRKRVLHAHGDSTGREINRTLLNRLQSLGRAKVLPYAFATRLLLEEDRCQGVEYFHEEDRTFRRIQSRAVILATGGLGVVYRQTTNPDIATGDGYALAFQAGAALADLEFVQFHPTALHLKGAPSFLLSEALRGEGGRLINRAGRPFMPDYHPLGDLAPRDVVARAIVEEVRRVGGECAYLDLTHLEPEFLRQRFPRIYSTCRRFGLDITRDRVPVFPAAHYMMGGVYTDLWGRTTVPGLWAAGEVACNGVHGANRLASNSLLEGLVFGARSGRAVAQRGEGDWKPAGQMLAGLPWSRRTRAGAPEREIIREQMSCHVGIVRSRESLQPALDFFNALPMTPVLDRRSFEYNSLLTLARLISWSALLRTESRGAHFRSDFPQKDDENWRCRILTRYDTQQEQVVAQLVGEPRSGRMRF